ncbi:hypothetical protein BAE44_0024615 [Dichanthelium oligosanthes]|uniref:AT3G52170-like helix-turn-helix domain-containing protein n=1 Tax=Dichanthelium oligosanthes TaxID=888268 RepID=A0A1E5UNH1_9POAL|nr:hypothetical protein BAE44_0024615 [Dichanthelium oligosanthes]
MGLCCSKKKPPAGGAKKPGGKVADDKAKKTAQQQPKRAPAKAAAGNAAGGKAAVFVVRAKDAAAGGEERKKPAAAAGEKPLPVVVVPSAPVRTSSCTKEEVDAILIQCGRLSRSSSGAGRAASNETPGGGHRRRRSGSKRSYDFDQDGRPGGAGASADEDWERQAAVSRPSPHRGSPQRKRSGSRERSGGGGTGSGSRRASRSPGRRTDGTATASVATAGSVGGERARQHQQPGKMVSVPAREKGRAPSPAAASGKRCASPRSSSPARMAVGSENAGCGPAAGPTPALSRSSSRKAEQSPYRRNPMAELDENSLRNNSNGNHGAKPQKKSIENAVAATPKKKATERRTEPTAAPSCRSGMEKPEITEDATVAASSEARAHPSKTSATRTASIMADSLSQRPAGQPGSRSRRSSRDFDQNPGSYTTQLLEDIQSYHQQSTSVAVPATPATPSFSLPACVAKACSIVEAVADLNSSSSENRTYEYEPGLSADDKGSVNVDSDGRVEPSAARKHVQPVRDFRAETEPQESAGSNSVSGHPWTPSWEPTSAESTDRTCSTGDEVVDQSDSHGARCSPMNRPRQSKQRPSQPEPSGRCRAGSSNGNTLHRGRTAHRGSSSVASGRFRASNDGKFPSASNVRQHIGGSYYTVRELLQELEYNHTKLPLGNAKAAPLQGTVEAAEHFSPKESSGEIQVVDDGLISQKDAATSTGIVEKTETWKYVGSSHHNVETEAAKHNLNTSETFKTADGPTLSDQSESESMKVITNKSSVSLGMEAKSDPENQQRETEANKLPMKNTEKFLNTSESSVSDQSGSEKVIEANVHDREHNPKHEPEDSTSTGLFGSLKSFAYGIRNFWRKL